jgi:ubiquinone biosynthesis protein UbiJ
MRLTGETLNRFKESSKFIRDRQNTTIAKLNQAAWMGENVDLLIDEIEALNRELERMETKIRNLNCA